MIKAQSNSGLLTIFMKNLILEASIGIYENEKKAKQRVRISVWLDAIPTKDYLNDDIENTVCYEMIRDHAKAIVDNGHINLVETFAEELAERCLINPLVKNVRVCIEKIDVMPEADSVGVEIFRQR